MSGLQLDQLQSCSSPIFVEEELTAGGTVHPVGVLAGSKPGIKRKATGSGSATAKKARPDVDEIIQVERHTSLLFCCYYTFLSIS